MRFLILIAAITFTCSSCKGQKKSNQLNTETMTQKIDTFDINNFNKNKHPEMLQYDFYSNNGDFVHQSESKVDYTENITKKGSKYGTYKSYYKSGELKDKGSFYDRIPIGKYINYNENGEIIEEKDFDKHYEFTLEDVLKYCKENGLVEKEILEYNKKVSLTLARTDSSNLTENDAIEWRIMYGPVPYTPKGSANIFASVMLYVLDGKTGKEIERKYKRIKIDKEWQPIED